MAVGSACRNAVSRHRGFSGPVFRYLEKGSDDLHGMYRTWIKQEFEINIAEIRQMYEQE